MFWSCYYFYLLQQYTILSLLFARNTVILSNFIFLSISLRYTTWILLLSIDGITEAGRDTCNIGWQTFSIRFLLFSSLGNYDCDKMSHLEHFLFIFSRFFEHIWLFFHYYITTVITYSLISKIESTKLLYWNILLQFWKYGNLNKELITLAHSCRLIIQQCISYAHVKIIPFI